MNIIERLQIPIKEQSELPKTYKALTVPISISSDKIIESIWSTLRYAPGVMATVSDEQIVFWREPLPRITEQDVLKAPVRTRT